MKAEGPMWNSMVNRVIFSRPIKRLLLPWARLRYNSHRRDESCDHVNCTCVWCRHGDHRMGRDRESLR